MSQPAVIPVKQIVLASLMAGMIIIGAQIAVPLGFSPVPIVLQNMFVLLAGLLLGRKWGVICVAIYLLIGIMGFPVFSKGGSGIFHLLGPTGGFLLSYLPAVWLVGAFSVKEKAHPGRDLTGLILASLMVYAIGVPWLKFSTGMDWLKAFTAGCVPFLIGDALKIGAAFFLGMMLKPLLEEMDYGKASYNRSKKSES